MDGHDHGTHARVIHQGRRDVEVGQHGNHPGRDRRTAADRDLIRQAILDGGLEQLDRITSIVEATGALQYTKRCAQEAADAAIAALDDVPESAYKQALIAIAELSVQRRN